MPNHMRRIAAAVIALAVSLGGAQAAEASCKTYKHRAKIESDPFGADLAYLNIKIRVCYNGRRITKAGTLDIEPSYTNNAMGTMEFQGVEPDPTAEYRSWHGRKKGSYYVKAGGNFQQRAWGVTGRSSYIWASMQIYGNGDVRKNRKND
jgi:hypothetical protein